MNDGKSIKISQETKYPWSGIIKISINTLEKSNLIIALRIPGWTQNQPVPSNLYQYLNKSDEKVGIKLNTEPIKFNLEKGYIKINREWEDNDLIELDFPMFIRRVIAHDKVRADRGKISLERGPIVYCIESIDNDSISVLDLKIPDDAKLISEFREDLFNGIVTLKNHRQDFLAIPYHAWAHRGKSEMTVWISRN